MSGTKEGERIGAIAKDAEWYIADVDLADNLSDLQEAAKAVSAAAPNTGVLLLSAGKKKMLALAIVPDARKTTASAKDIIEAALKDTTNEVKDLDSGNVLGTVAGDADKSVFPIKVKDTARAKAAEFMAKKGCFGENNDDDDDDEFVFGDDAEF